MSVPSSSSNPRAGRVLGVFLLLVVIALAVAPWWRNRGFVRSFYDYGVIMGGVGRIVDGQKPYADFISPIQTGWFFFNWAVERVAGGTFQAMTWSAVVCIVVAAAALGGMLRTRWPLFPAFVVTAAIVCATMPQHTIMWYNPWGVFLLAVVAWAGAVAPVLGRGQAGWHVLAGAALFLGGMNKINMQLMAICLGGGWALRAALHGRATWGRAGATLAFYLGCGVVLPVLAEMAWTGVSFSRWWFNVIAQMGTDRGNMLVQALRWEFLFKPCHDYYGPLRLPQVGLTGVLLTLATTVAIVWHARGGRVWLERALGVVCGAVAFLGGEVLLATNMDIAYIALGGWLALLVALWIGFGLPARGPWFYAILVLPSVLIAAVSWESAWRGQRSQFGHSTAPRHDYRPASEAGAAYGYFRGTHVPPEMFDGLKAVAAWREALPPERARRVLFGPGSEFSAHIWPAARTPDLPLYILGGFQFGPEAYAATFDVLNRGRFLEITVAEVLDFWRNELSALLLLRYDRRTLGGAFYRYSRVPEDHLSNSPRFFIERFGGSTDPRALASTGRIFESDERRLFLGTTEGRETMKLTVPTNRLRGQVVVRRVDPKSTEPLAANFTIFAEANEQARFPRWEQRVELPAEQQEVMVDYAIDSSQLPTRFFVDIPPEFAGRVAAGWRGPAIYHAGADGPAEPRWLYHSLEPVVQLTPEEIAAVFPGAPSWRPEYVLVRGGRVSGTGVELRPGGELWIRVPGLATEFTGDVAIEPQHGMGRAPIYRSMWMKDFRLDFFTQSSLTPEARRGEFRGWTPEPGGWLIVAMDPAEGGPPARVQVTGIKHQPWP